MDPDRKTPPRIYCLAATEAPVLAVFRRGPTQWSHVGRWDVEADRYEPGAWLRGRIFPRRSDISPDGTFLCYFAHKPTATWDHGDAWVAISRLPWLTALHACGTCGTWTRGYYFSTDDREEPGADPLPIPWRLRSIPALQFANERRRGWIEAEDSPPRDPLDTWDERRNARMLKPQPGGRQVLRVESMGWAGGDFGIDQAVDGIRVRYTLEADGALTPLDDLQWADWDRNGRLLTATRSGALQVRSPVGDGLRVVFEENLSELKPDPSPPPDRALHW